MRSASGQWSQSSGWTWAGEPDTAARLVLCFAAPDAMTRTDWNGYLRETFPNAIIAACSTGGEICGPEVYDGTMSVLALSFQDTDVEAASVTFGGAGEEDACGRRLAETLFRSDLAAVLALSDGTQVNGSALIRGMRAVLGTNVVVTGGLAGDGANFVRTCVGLNGAAEPGRICAIGLYGKRIRVGHGSAGGWDVFGPERRITRAQGNRLYELDGKPALDLYKSYLGDEAQRLPGSALLFPLQIFQAGQPDGALVRTVVGIDEEARAMVFAGDIPEGWGARLMRGNFDHLVQGAAEAAHQANAQGASRAAILVSCIGRKLLMGQRIGEEVEAVQAVLGADVALTGFYSYGEISPHAASGVCELHNQTMTVTTLWEE